MKEMKVAGFTQWLVNVALNGTTEGLIVDEHPLVPLNGYGLFRIATS